MMGRKLRAPSELLRSRGITQTGPTAEYHRRLVNNTTKATSAAHSAQAKDQLRRERYYSRRVRHDVEFGVGALVWVFKPPRGKGITNLAHQWVGPARIVQAAGFDNWEVVRDDTDEHWIHHCSFLVSSRCPSDSLGVIAEKLLAELEQEDGASDGGSAVGDGAEQGGSQHDGESTAATTSSGNTADESTVGESRDEGQMMRGDTTRDVTAGTSGRESVTTAQLRVPVPTRTTLSGQDEEEKQRTVKAREETKERRRREADEREARVAWRLHVTSRRPQKQKQLVQTLLVVFLAVRKPMITRPTQLHDEDPTLTITEVTAKPPPMPELLQVETAGYIAERARRRVRNRAGRYVREHQVEYSTGPGQPTGRRWLTEEEFEQLDDAAKVTDDLGAGDGV
ncbi:RNA-dependent DNA polymerase [Phytophthora cinnamomi]|uniref:RNA-dependent DNA polymerase n=1 Tax=Phytophthora cinnamomi TaxID=4785 RepID=UPI00355A3B4E|nr:RNA-dependent DNA polymerase [Phytophthora cinnamomi]